MKYVLVLIFVFCKFAFANYDQSLYGYPKIGNPYIIGGKKYYPKEYSSLVQEGFISWYGPGFHAKTTANGATFDKNTYTVAHKTLQLPSVIEITNLENGRKVIAVVNDRGPFSETQSRILDASERVAKELDFINKGVIKGRIKLLKKETEDLLAGRKVKLGPVNQNNKVVIANNKGEEVAIPTKSTFSAVKHQSAEDKKTFYIQVGVFRHHQNRVDVVAHLKKESVPYISIVYKTDSNNNELEVVRVGPFFEKDVYKMLTKLKNLGYYNSKVLNLD